MSKKTDSLDFATCFNIAETAARVLYEERPSADKYLHGLSLEVSSNLRMMARGAAVSTLRWLWRTGDAEQRVTVACRVAVWLGRTEQWPGGAHIRSRESRRLARRVRHFHPAPSPALQEAA